jgi:hypothetical protein
MTLIAIAIAVLFLAVGATGVESLQVLGNPRPGGVLFITVTGAGPGTKAEASFGDARYRFCEGHTGLSVPVAISANESPCERILTVTLTLPSGERRMLTRTLKIKAHRFRKEYLTMSASNAAKYTAPEVVKEDEMVRSVRDDLIERQLWTKPFVMPCGDSRGTAFGVRRIVNGKDNDYHGGQDIRAPYGRPVKAMNDGVVALAETGFVLRGKTIIVNHGQGLTTMYIHMSRLAVKKGQKVSRGQTIGYVGSTGASTGPHLHFAAYCGRTPFDPLLLLKPPASWTR